MGTMDQQWWVVGPRSARLLPEVHVFPKVFSKPHDFIRLLICCHIMRPNLVERSGPFYAGVFEDAAAKRGAEDTAEPRRWLPFPPPLS